MSISKTLLILCSIALLSGSIAFCLQDEEPSEGITRQENYFDSEDDFEVSKGPIHESLFMESATFLKHIKLELENEDTYLIGLSDLLLILSHEVLPVSPKLRSSVFSTVKKAYNKTRGVDGAKHRPHVIEILEKSVDVWPEDDDQRTRMLLWMSKLYEAEGRDPEEERVLREADRDVKEKTQAAQQQPPTAKQEKADENITPQHRPNAHLSQKRARKTTVKAAKSPLKKPRKSTARKKTEAGSDGKRAQRRKTTAKKPTTSTERRRRPYVRKKPSVTNPETISTPKPPGVDRPQREATATPKLGNIQRPGTVRTKKTNTPGITRSPGEAFPAWE